LLPNEEYEWSNSHSDALVPLLFAIAAVDTHTYRCGAVSATVEVKGAARVQIRK